MMELSLDRILKSTLQGIALENKVKIQLAKSLGIDIIDSTPEENLKRHIDGYFMEKIPDYAFDIKKIKDGFYVAYPEIFGNFGYFGSLLGDSENYGKGFIVFCHENELLVCERRKLIEYIGIKEELDFSKEKCIEISRELSKLRNDEVRQYGKIPSILKKYWKKIDLSHFHQRAYAGQRDLTYMIEVNEMKDKGLVRKVVGDLTEVNDIGFIVHETNRIIEMKSKGKATKELIKEICSIPSSEYRKFAKF